MWENDSASQRLGMTLEHIELGKATISMKVTSEMANGHGNCHGGYVFMLADSAFAFSCNTYGQKTVGQHCAITYLLPCQVGDRLTAYAVEVSRQGRSGIYDIRVINQNGSHVAEFRGHSRITREVAK